MSRIPSSFTFGFVRIACLLIVLATGCTQREEPEPDIEPPEPFAHYEQVELTIAEQRNLLDAVQTVLGHPYVWGGDSATNGFDCSGLIQWAYRELGVNQFRNDEAVYPEIAAHELFHYNTRPIENVESTRTGDFVFFDVNGDGRITHNAVLDRVDEQGQIWVYDSYSVAGGVVHRRVENFWDKGPRFGRPLKTMPRPSKDTERTQP